MRIRSFESFRLDRETIWPSAGNRLGTESLRLGRIHGSVRTRVPHLGLFFVAYPGHRERYDEEYSKSSIAMDQLEKAISGSLKDLSPLFSRVNGRKWQHPMQSA